MYEKYKTIFAGLFPKKKKSEKRVKPKIAFNKSALTLKRKI
jgi:hypothetical protein